MILKVKKLREDAMLPKYAKEGDAGADIFAVEPIIVPANGRALVKTGIAIELEHNSEAQVRGRSGLALKNGITVLNSPGTIDEQYRGEVGVILFNTTDEPFEVNKYDRIAQLVVKPVTQAHIIEVDELTETSRGENGFGSTGVK